MAARIMTALGYIDMTMSSNAETKTRWRNDEVLSMLGDIRETLTDDTL